MRTPKRTEINELLLQLERTHQEQQHIVDCLRKLVIEDQPEPKRNETRYPRATTAADKNQPEEVSNFSVGDIVRITNRTNKPFAFGKRTDQAYNQTGSIVKITRKRLHIKLSSGLVVQRAGSNVVVLTTSQKDEQQGAA
jgi:hypothetical protein